MWEWMQYKSLIKSLAFVHKWETSDEALMGTMIGRHVFLCIAAELNEAGAIEGEKSLKKMFSHPRFTDRAIRLKLRELESKGYIILNLGSSDKRSRFLQVTPKFLECAQQHRWLLSKSLKSNSLMII